MLPRYAEAPDCVRALADKIQRSVETHLEEADVACSRAPQRGRPESARQCAQFIDGRERRVVAISSSCAGASCAITITDTGPGIPERDHARIFEPLYRVPGVRAHGHGIGLATVARIVHAHGGTIEVESELGVGTTFQVRLPAVTLDTASPAAPPHDAANR
ncbi:MAG: sensor histidine kinase [Byssovorax sp.]